MEDGSKVFGKSRWRGKLFSKEHDAGAQKGQLNTDVMDFLAPSRNKAMGSAAPKPKLDISAAKRWPDASEIKMALSPNVNSAIRGAKVNKRGKILTVAFVRTAPEIIGEGGDMAEDPVVEVSRSKQLQNPKRISHQDDGDLNKSSPPITGLTPRPGALQSDYLGDRPSLPVRADTSHGEISSHLQQRLEKRKSPPLPPRAPQPGEGFGFRPKPLARAPTGFNNQTEHTISAESLDDFTPKPLRRAQTGFTPGLPPADEQPKLPNIEPEDHSPIDPSERARRTFSTQMRKQMRAEEGQAFHKAALHRDSDENERPQTASDGSSYHSPHSDSHAARTQTDQEFMEPVLGSTQGPFTTSSSKYPSPADLQTFSLPSISPPQPQSRNSPYQALPPPKSTSPGRVSPQPNTQRPRLGLSPQPIGPRDSPKQFWSSPEPSSVQQPPRSYVPLPSPHTAPVESTTENLLERDLAQQAYQNRRQRADTALSTTPSAGDVALDDFADRIVHMRGIFRLTAELERPLFEHSPAQLLRAAIWWFLRGRTGLEDMIRNRPRDGSKPKEMLTQPHVDLAKTWWIVTEVIQAHPTLQSYGDHSPLSQSKVARDSGDHATADLYESTDAILSSLKALVSSMSRNGVMPPQQALIQGQDQSIWIKYPKFASDVASMLAGSSSRSLLADNSSKSINPAAAMPLGDTKDDFCYGRMFVHVSLSTDDVDTDRVTLPCVLTLLRPRDDWRLKVAICSQNELVNLLVQSDRKAGPTWDDVQWKSKARSLLVKLPRGFSLNAEFQEKDYRQLWNIYEYTTRIERNLVPEPEEILTHEVVLREFQYTNPSNPQAFPPERIKRCRVRIFERYDHHAHGTGLRRFHRGYRFVVANSPRNKTLSSVCHTLGTQAPIDFEFRADPVGQDSLPALQLRCNDSKSNVQMFLGFNETKDRSALFAALTGMNATSEEIVYAQMPLKGLSIQDLGDGSPIGTGAVMDSLRWQDVKVLTSDPEQSNTGLVTTVLNEHLRIVARHNAGSWTDWMNFAAGELQIRLDTAGTPELLVKRGPQRDVTVSIDAKRADPGASEDLTTLITSMEAAPTIRTFKFHNLKDLHTFQTAITGFTVRFDGVASTVHIARRRAVVPIYKKWEASKVRIQIVERDSVYQVACYFENFSHAAAMAFQIKQMDVFEKVDKGNKFSGGSNWGLKLADAKFALPGGKGEGREGKGEKNRFVSLDLLEYAGEHDDITVGFETQEERDRFSRALPAATQVVRSMTMRRKI